MNVAPIFPLLLGWLGGIIHVVKRGIFFRLAVIPIAPALIPLSLALFGVGYRGMMYYASAVRAKIWGGVALIMVMLPSVAFIILK